MYTIVSTRFNNETFQENVKYREKKGYACIYCSPQPMSPKILPHSAVFVVEMNNTTNEIEGIGLIKNTYETDSYYNVYDIRNFNRYYFKGNYRISRFELLKNHEKLVEILDTILFKGKTHMKRGAGFTSISEKIWSNPKCEQINIKNWIKQIFIEKYGK